MLSSAGLGRAKPEYDISCYENTDEQNLLTDTLVGNGLIVGTYLKVHANMRVILLPWTILMVFTVTALAFFRAS